MAAGRTPWKYTWEITHTPDPGGISGEKGGKIMKAVRIGLYATDGKKYHRGGLKMAKDSYMHIRINSELKEQAQKLAEADGRDLTNWITWLIRKEIEKAAEK